MGSFYFAVVLVVALGVLVLHLAALLAAIAIGVPFEVFSGWFMRTVAATGAVGLCAGAGGLFAILLEGE